MKRVVTYDIPMRRAALASARISSLISSSTFAATGFTFPLPNVISFASGCCHPRGRGYVKLRKSNWPISAFVVLNRSSVISACRLGKGEADGCVFAACSEGVGWVCLVKATFWGSASTSLRHEDDINRQTIASNPAIPFEKIPAALTARAHKTTRFIYYPAHSRILYARVKLRYLIRCGWSASTPSRRFRSASYSL